MLIPDTPSRTPTPTIAAARQVWSRAVTQLEQGRLSEAGYEAAGQRLRRIRDALELPQRTRVELYLDLLEQAWSDRRPDTAPRRASDRLLAAHRALASGFAEGGDRDLRRERARGALRDLEHLAAQAGDDGERVAIVRLADPLLRLLSALEAAPVPGALQ